MRSYLPSSTFETAIKELKATPPASPFGSTSAIGYLSCGNGAVGVYLGQPFSVWAEIQTSSGSIHQLSMVPVVSLRMNGLAVLSPGKEFASFLSPDQTSGLYRLSSRPDGTGEWVPVEDEDASSSAGAVSLVFGPDDTSIVHLRGSQDSVTLYWSQPE